VSAAFKTRYGSVGVVAGASEGLGAAFAIALAARGLDLVLLARRGTVLDALADELRSAHHVQVTTAVADLADPSFAKTLARATDGLEVGIGVYNAAASFTGRLLDRPLGDALHLVDVNIAGPLRFVHAVVPAMRARRRGGLVLMSSLAGCQGAPQLAAYAASKAFNIVLGESLWGELRGEGVDVVTSCPGAIRTPNFAKASTTEAPGTLDSRVVAELTLEALGHGPIVVPGGVNKLALFLMRRLMSRRSAVTMMQTNIEKTLGEAEHPPTGSG
jgi:short-subunit dehydrogenase